MKSSIRAGLIALSAWAMAFVVVAAAATVCSSCGTKPSPTSKVDCR